MVSGLGLLGILLAVVVGLIWAVALLKLSPILALLLAALVTGLLTGLPPAKVAASMQGGFGTLMGQIGLMVTAGSLLATYLDKTRAAERLALTLLQMAGPRRTPGVMAGVGYAVGVPVFCDAGFMLLGRLVPGLAQRGGVPTGRLYLTLAAGLFATHSLVPPTPGPVAAAGAIGAAQHLAWVMLMGAVVAVPAAAAGFWVLRRGVAATAAAPAAEAQLPPLAGVAAVPLPGLMLAVLPVVLPIALIAAASMLPAGAQGLGLEVLRTVGAPFVSLMLGAALLYLLAGPPTRRAMASGTAQAFVQAGNILLITGAGGAFGGIIKETPLAASVTAWLGPSPDAGVGLLVIGFLLAALVKVAQGSTTAAMAVSGSVMGGLLAGTIFAQPLPAALMVAALGAGAMVVSHVNDSYFWIVSQMSGIPPGHMLRTHTLATGAMGLAALLAAVLLFVAFT